MTNEYSQETLEAVNKAIDTVLEHAGGAGQKDRYKAMRALAFQAFVEAAEEGEIGSLTKRAIKNLADLPRGWSVSSRRVGGETAADPKPEPRKRGRRKSEPEVEPEPEVKTDPAPRKRRPRKAAEPEVQAETEAPKRRPRRA